jgi:MoaA/NifB/PqqE/SkfB family radical SAM enzyme
MCSYWRNPSRPETELNLAEITRALERLHGAGVRMINFTGGEPTLRSDLEEIVAQASALGFWTSIVTNGSTLTQDRIRRLKGSGLDNLFISLDSPEPEKHDASRCIPGLHQKVMQGLQWLHEEFLTGHRTGGIFCVLTANNAEDIFRVLQIAEQAGVFAIVQPYHGAKTGSDCLSPSLTDSLVDVLAKLRHQNPCLLSTQSYLKGISSFLGHQELPRCNAGTKYFSIDPFGFLHPCVDSPAVGHVLRDDLSVLRGPAATKAVAACRGCWYCFRGEADTTLRLRGYLEKVSTVGRVLKTNITRSKGRERLRCGEALGPTSGGSVI